MSDRSSRSPDRRSRSPSPGRSRSRSPDRRSSRSPVRQQRRRSSSPDSLNDGCSLHFSNLHVRTQERDLENLCSEYGRVDSVKLVTDPKTGEGRGFAFVVMDTRTAADSVIDNLDGKELDGRRLTVQKSKRKQGRPPTPGQYLGIPKRDFGGRRGGRFDNYRRDDRRYDDRRYDDRRYDDRRYDDRRYDDRRNDDRRY